jgi:hypothetical protein
VLEERHTVQVGTAKAQPRAGEKAGETRPGNQQTSFGAQAVKGASGDASGELRSMSGESGIRLGGTASWRKGEGN